MKYAALVANSTYPAADAASRPQPGRSTNRTQATRNSGNVPMKISSRCPRAWYIIGALSIPRRPPNAAQPRSRTANQARAAVPSPARSMPASQTRL